MDWHKLEIEEAFQKLKTSEHGLTQGEVEERLLRFGPNTLPEGEGFSRLKILLHQFASPLIYMLIIAGVVTALLQEYKDTIVIFAVIALNAVIGYLQEFKAEESIRALKKIMVPRARVVRDGQEKEIDSENLVPGDVVLLESGNKVPADLRLIKTLEARVDESILTGESLPVEKTSASIHEDNLTPGDQKNMAFMGTVVVSGRTRGLVVETGAGTVLGSIAERVKEIGITRAPLQVKFDRFANVIGLIVLASASALLLLGLWVGESLKDMFMTAVAVAVAAIPEGLPVVVTIALAVSVARMARNNAIIRKLPAVETLGSTTVICSDKTGTLTKNEMTVKLIYDGAHVYEVTGTGYEPTGEILAEWLKVKPSEQDSVRKVLRIGLLCNESKIIQEDGDYRVQGDPTEGALIVAAMKSGLDAEEENRSYRELAIIPFESERGYMATLHEHDGNKLIFVKGAPERVVAMCSSCMAGDGERMRTIMEVAENFAKDGLRVLAMAYKEAPADLDELTHDQIESGLIVAGLQGMIDPPRPEAVEAIEGCHGAGVRVAMITGDHAITAMAIAKTLGIARGGEQVLTGRDLEDMTDEELYQKVKEVSVYARVAPEHKLRIVQQLLKHGEIVAVTGDGVNDAPALKAAHIGVAMGKSGTDVAKEASDMVVTDDNFASIFAAVKEGRIVFDNIRKVTFFLIPTGVAAILSIIGTVVAGLPIPYVPAQLLWINLVTNGLQDVALAFEPGEKDVAERPPRDPQEGIMSRLLIERTIIVGVIIAAGIVYNFATALQQGETLEKARTVAVTTMVFFQFFQAWNSRSELQSIFRVSPTSNPFLLYALIAATFAQLALIYVPALQWVFRTEPLNLGDWVGILGISATVIVVVEIDKWLRRRSKSNTAVARI
jgi:Ca2+-transporting ATPase